MRDRWYADNRDLVKWGAIVYLAHKCDIANVLYVALHRVDRRRLKLTIRKHRTVDYPMNVYSFFRDIRRIHGLARLAKLKVILFKKLFQSNGIMSRRDYGNLYFGHVVRQITKHNNKSLLVFLDPDTGIAPKSCKYEHIAKDEIRATWDAMNDTSGKNRVLVFYQHARLRQKRWLSSTHKAFTSVFNKSPGVHTGFIKCADLAVARDLSETKTG